MARRLVLPAALMLAGSLAGQTLSVCAGLNHLTTASNQFSLAAGLRVGVLFVPAATMQVTQVNFYFPSSNAGGTIGINVAQGTFEIRPNDPVSNLPAPATLASATLLPGGGVISATGGWQGPTFSTALVLQGGVPVWLTYTRAPATGAATLGVQNTPPGPDVTVASYESGGAWGPVTVVDQFKVRLRSTNCTPPGPLASWTTVGQGCPGTGSLTPALTPVGLPILGNFNSAITVSNALPNASFGLFWSFSADPFGTPLGGACTMFLETNGFLALAALGLQPFYLGALDATGTFTYPLPVPNDPALSGLGAAFQAAIADPAGVTISPNTTIVVTEAEAALIGL